MYNYNSIHKVIVAFLVVAWAIYHFSTRDSEKNLYYDNGQVKRVGSKENSLNEGTWTWYHVNGNIQIQGNYHKGQKDGLWKTYDTSGTLTSESSYEMGVLVPTN